MTRDLRKFFKATWIVIAIVIIWQISVDYFAINSIVMASPAAIVQEVIKNWPAFGAATLQTILFAAIGATIGIAIGTLLAIASWWSRIMSGLLTPLSLIFASVPVVAIIPVLARIFGYDARTVLAIVAIISFFPAFVFTTAGLRSLPPGSADLFHVLGVSKLGRLFYLAIPSAIPEWAIALRLAAANAILAAIVAEFLMGTSGLGYMFNVARGDLNMSNALGASAIAAAISIFSFFVASTFERRLRDRWL
jgi:NitT/TauT family transport system permease protein